MSRLTLKTTLDLFLSYRTRLFSSRLRTQTTAGGDPGGTVQGAQALRRGPELCARSRGAGVRQDGGLHREGCAHGQTDAEHHSARQQAQGAREFHPDERAQAGRKEEVKYALICRRVSCNAVSLRDSIAA